MAAFPYLKKVGNQLAIFVCAVIYILVLQVVTSFCFCPCLTLKRVGNQVSYFLILLIFRNL